MVATPNWVSKDLFQNALHNFYQTPDIDIISFTSKNAVPEGDNYTSDLFRTTLRFINRKTQKEETISVIVKCCNEDGGAKQDIAKHLHIFDKEAEMFTKTFPALYEILGQKYTLSSKCLYATIQPHSVVVLEDLTTLGYEMLPRHIGFDLEHCFKVIDKMAQLHAASVILYEKDPVLLKPYFNGLYADNEMIRAWLRSSYEGLIDACSRWPGFEKYGKKLSELGEKALERSFKSCKRTYGGFHVLNHGDLWVNNMMFSYDLNGNLQDMIFVDFQMNIFTSPAIDLHYFIATSTKMDVKHDHINTLLDYYYAQLLGNLTKLQYSLERVPTREQIKKDYVSRGFYGLMAAATVLPLVKASKRKDASFENVINDKSLDGFRYHAFNNDRYRKHMEFLLPYYDSLGIFD